MSRYERLGSNQNFKIVYDNGRSFGNKYLVMYVFENGRSTGRFGVSVSKKVGNSIVRHRLTRLIRECVRLNGDKLKDGYDIVIIARQALKGKTYFDTEKAFLHLAKHLDIIIKEET